MFPTQALRNIIIIFMAIEKRFLLSIYWRKDICNVEYCNFAYLEFYLSYGIHINLYLYTQKHKYVSTLM